MNILNNNDFSLSCGSLFAKEKDSGFKSHIPRQFYFRVISVAIFGDYAQIIVKNNALPPMV